jgi:hypothetical protein
MRGAFQESEEGDAAWDLAGDLGGVIDVRIAIANNVAGDREVAAGSLDDFRVFSEESFLKEGYEDGVRVVLLDSKGNTETFERLLRQGDR